MFMATTRAFGLSRNEQSTGMVVNDTTKDATIKTIVAIAMGENRRPLYFAQAEQRQENKNVQKRGIKD